MNGTGLEILKYIVSKYLMKRRSHGVLCCALNTFVETIPPIFMLSFSLVHILCYHLCYHLMLSFIVIIPPLLSFY